MHLLWEQGVRGSNPRTPTNRFATVVKQVYTADLKSAAARRAGSIPASRTSFVGRKLNWYKRPTHNRGTVSSSLTRPTKSTGRSTMDSTEAF